MSADIIDHLLSRRVRLEAKLRVVFAHLTMVILGVVSQAIVDVFSASLSVGVGLALVREHLAKVSDECLTIGANLGLDCRVRADSLVIDIAGAELLNGRFLEYTIGKGVRVRLSILLLVSVGAQDLKVRKFVGGAESAIVDSADLVNQLLA